MCYPNTHINFLESRHQICAMFCGVLNILVCQVQGVIRTYVISDTGGACVPSSLYTTGLLKSGDVLIGSALYWRRQVTPQYERHSDGNCNGRHSILAMCWLGVGVTKAPFANVSVKWIFIFIKYLLDHIHIWRESPLKHAMENNGKNKGTFEGGVVTLSACFVMNMNFMNLVRITFVIFSSHRRNNFTQYRIKNLSD